MTPETRELELVGATAEAMGWPEDRVWCPDDGAELEYTNTVVLVCPVCGTAAQVTG
jgi:hypothetical protein